MDIQEVSITFAFLAGLLSFVSPCVLPLIPSYISFITGISVEELIEGRGRGLRKVIIANSILFIIGFSLVFIAMGASATIVGEVFVRHQVIVRKIGGIVIILLGLHVIGMVNISILQREKRLHFFHGKPAGIFGSLLVGIGFAAAWTPCVGPILGSILIMAGSSSTLWTGIGLLSIYSLGLGLPFLLTSLGINAFLRYFKRFRIYMRSVSIVTGFFLIVIGIMVFTNYFTLFTGYLNRILPSINV